MTAEAEKQSIEEAVLEMRRAFDQSFSEEPSKEVTRLENLLLIRVGPNPYAVRLSEVSALSVDPKIALLPSPIPEMIGIAGFRGAIAPIYSLRGLLGHSNGAELRWLIFVQGEGLVGLAFDQFEGHLRVPLETIAAADGKDDSGRHTPEVVGSDGLVLPIVRLSSILEAIKEKVAGAAKGQEHKL